MKLPEKSDSKRVAGLGASPCSASSFRIIAELDSENFQAFPQPGSDRITLTREGAKRFASVLIAWADGNLESVTGRELSLRIQMNAAGETEVVSGGGPQPDSSRGQGCLSPIDETSRQSAPSSSHGSDAACLPLSNQERHGSSLDIRVSEVQSSCDVVSDSSNSQPNV